MIDYEARRKEDLLEYIVEVEVRRIEDLAKVIEGMIKLCYQSKYDPSTARSAVLECCPDVDAGMLDAIIAGVYIDDLDGLIREKAMKIMDHREKREEAIAKISAVMKEDAREEHLAVKMLEFWRGRWLRAVVSATVKAYHAADHSSGFARDRVFWYYPDVDVSLVDTIIAEVYDEPTSCATCGRCQVRRAFGVIDTEAVKGKC